MDEFRDVEHVSYGSSIMESIKGVVAGLLLFLAAFVVLWKTEGCEDLSKLARRAKVLRADKSDSPVDKSADGQLVSLSGRLETSEHVTDPRFLREGRYIRLDRVVEMYAWRESKQTETKTELGGGKKRVTTYRYEMVWTASPTDSSGFKHTLGHFNPPKRVRDRSFYAEVGMIGPYRLTPKTIALPPSTPIKLDAAKVHLSGGARLVEQRYIFLGEGTPKAPQVGDVRIQLRGVPRGLEVTAFAKLEGNRLAPYRFKEQTLYRVFLGDRETALGTMKTEHNRMIWFGRIAGFLMMWIGLSLFFGPINAVLDVIPFLGEAGRFIVAVAMFVVAFLLSVVTSLVAIIAHNIWILIGVLVLGLIGLFALRLARKRNARA
ncbi:MAG: TMEM43 family protein [Myxococcales bacterium]|nr:TMEM43 family protein [Myxococcales bacterium]